MSEAATPEIPVKPSTGFIKVILSSSLASAFVAMLGTLAGLLFRTGWLGVYGVETELFFPESATELAYWAFLAVLFTLSDASQWLSASALLLFGMALTYGLVMVAVGILATWSKKYDNAIDETIAPLRTSAKARIAFAGGLAFTGVIVIPWALISVAVLLISVPLYGHTTGKTAAEESRRNYEAALKKGKSKCQTLTGTTGPIGQCPMVIAQSKERIAYMDGDRVHVIPAQGISVSWTPDPLPLRGK